jgi:hypothetical protein
MDWEKSIQKKLSKLKISYSNLLLVLICLYTALACGIIRIVLDV